MPHGCLTSIIVLPTAKFDPVSSCIFRVDMVDGIFTYKSCFNLIILDDYVGNKAMGKTGM